MTLQDPPLTTEQVMGQPALATRAVTLQDECNVQGVRWNDDSTRAYVSMEATAVDVWPVLVRYWPELAGSAGSLVLTIILSCLLRRRWRQRHHASGEPYCRRCFYQLTGRSGAVVCPECGARLGSKGIVFGGTLRRWPVVVVAVVLALVVAGYFAGRSHVPRKGTASNWFRWPSTRLYNWAVAHQYWSLTYPNEPLLRIVEFDPSAGAVTRTIFSEMSRRGDGTSWNGRIYRAPSPDRLLLTTSTTAVQLDIATGAIVRTYALPPELADQRAGITDVALHPTRPVLYAYVGFNTVGQWNLDTGEWSELMRFPDRSESLMYSLFPMADADLVILRRGLPRRAPQSGFDLIDLSTVETVCSVRGEAGDVDYVIGVASNELFYSSYQWRRAGSGRSRDLPIMRWMPGQDEPNEAWRIPLERITEIYSARSGRMYLSSHATWSTGLNAGIRTSMIATYDRQTDRYLTPLAFPPRIGEMKLSISPDERWAITWHPEPTTGPALFIFDLHAIHGGASQQPAR